MKIVNKYSESIWRKQEEKFKVLEKEIKIPNEKLDNVDFVLIKKGEIIYNGIAKDNVRLRIEHHLLGKADAKWSGISIDIYPKESKSHRKKVMSSSGKVPYVDCVSRKNGAKSYACIPIRTKKLLSSLFLSSSEKKYIKVNNAKVYHFRNGINIFEKKHHSYKFSVYFITGLNWLFLEYIEKKWREKYGLPKLCSYSSGR